MTLLHMATMDTTRISNLVLVAGTTFFPEGLRKFWMEFSGSSYEGAVNNLKSIHPGGEEQAKAILTQWINMGKAYDDMNFTKPFLGTIGCPTLVIHGDRDPFFPVEIPVSLYNAIPNSYLWIVPNDGHIPVGIYDRNSIWSDVLYKTLDEFLGGNWEQK